MKKRICFINLNGAALYFPDCFAELENFIGGSEVDTFIISRMFQELGYQMEVLLSVPGKPDESWEQDGIMIHNFPPVAAENPKQRLLRLWRRFRQIDSPLWFTKIISPVSAILGLYCWLHRRKLIYKTANQRDFLLATGKGIYPFRQRLYFHLTRLGTSLYIAQTEDQREGMARWFNHPGRHLVRIPNAHPPLPVLPLALAEREFILWVGHLTPVKHPELFFEFAAALPHRKFIMVAAIRDNKQAELYRRQAEEIDNLELVENVPFSEMSDYFLRAQVLVNTSESEGFPNTFLQAFQTLTPLLTIGVDPDGMIKNAGLGKVAHDVPEMAEWLQQLLEQPEQYSLIQENLEHFTREHFSYELVKEKYRKIVEEIT